MNCRLPHEPVQWKDFVAEVLNHLRFNFKAPSCACSLIIQLYNVQLIVLKVCVAERQGMTARWEEMQHAVLPNITRVNKLRSKSRARQAAGQERRECLNIVARTPEDLEDTGVVGRRPTPKTARPPGSSF
jgi:hypothetical protein